MNIAVFYGGRSVEHEVSVITALQVMKTLLFEHNIIPVYLDKENRMFSNKSLFEKRNYLTLSFNQKDELFIDKDDLGAFIYNKRKPKRKEYFDLAFLCFHGKGVEDGTTSALFELLNIPYVGPNILSSSICQNKYFTKRFLENMKINVVPYENIRSNKIDERTMKKIDLLGFPIILKPISLGSSIGVEIANNYQELKEKIQGLFMFDEEIILEKYVAKRKEYNIAVLRNKDKIILSDIEEVGGGEILSYDDKYLVGSDGMQSCKRIFPAKISNSLRKQIEYMARKAFITLNCQNIVRFDFIYDLENAKIYLNEINTIPGSYANYLFKDKYTFKELLEIVCESSLFAYDMKNKKVMTLSNEEIYKIEDALKK